MDEFDDVEDVGEKPSYDARLEYYKVMKAYMMALAKSSLMDDANTTLRMLWGLFSMVKPYIKKSDAETLKEKLVRIRHQLRASAKTPATSKSIILARIDDELQDMQEELFMASKYIMLPVGGDKVTEFNEQDFLRGSDL